MFVLVLRQIALTDTTSVHRSDDFKPERMLDGRFEALPVSIDLRMASDP